MNRFVIVGSTGSGKTTLARELSRIIGAPQIELDALNWSPGWTAAPTDVFRTKVAEAVSAGFYEHKTNKQQYPRLQLRTVKELMEGKPIERPSNTAAIDETSKKAPKAEGHQEELL